MKNAKLEKLRAPRVTEKGPDCPPVEVWLSLAGGLLSTAEQERYTSHAATCDHCGPVLREIVRDFEGPVTEEEEAVLAELKSTGSIPQDRSTTRVVSPQPVPHPWRWFGLTGWQVATAAALVLAALGFSLYKADIFSKKGTVAAVTQLLAKAYGEHRITDLRIPEGKYGPVRVARSGPGSQFSSPPALLKAEGLIAGTLETQPNNTELLRRRAEAELLRGNYQDAITTLNSIANQGKTSSAVLQDLGTAYFESAENSGSGESRKLDYAKAYQYTSQALNVAPENSEILFNRAIIDERLQLLDQAVADWNQFLRFEHDPQWVSEGRKHLEDIEGKKKLAP